MVGPEADSHRLEPSNEAIALRRWSFTGSSWLDPPLPDRSARPVAAVEHRVPGDCGPDAVLRNAIRREALRGAGGRLIELASGKHHARPRDALRAILRPSPCSRVSTGWVRGARWRI